MQLIDLEDMIAHGEYSAADSMINLMQGNNTYENNLLTVYGIVINRNLPEYRALSGGEIITLTAIAEVHPRVGGNAVFSARAMMEYETGQVFVDIETISRPTGLAVQLNYSSCPGGLLPGGFTIKLKDNTSYVYNAIPVSIDDNGLAYIKAADIATLDNGKTYTFELFSPVGLHIEPTLQPLSTWLGNIQTVVLCTGIVYGKNGGSKETPTTTDETPKSNSTVSQQLTTDNKQLTVYPNPTSNKLNVLLPVGEFNVEVFDIKGMLISKQENISEKTEIETLNLREGLYLVKAINKADGTTLTQKFIVKR